LCSLDVNDINRIFDFSTEDQLIDPLIAEFYPVGHLDMGPLLRSTLSNSSRCTLGLQTPQISLFTNKMVVRRTVGPISRVSVVALAGKGKGNKGFSKNVRFLSFYAVSIHESGNDVYHD